MKKKKKLRSSYRELYNDKLDKLRRYTELAKYHKLGRTGKQKRQKVTGKKGKD